MQLENLSNKLKEPEIKEFVEGLFPKDHPKKYQICNQLLYKYRLRCI